MVHASWNAVLKSTRNPEHAVLGIGATSMLTSIVVAVVMHAPLPPRESLAWCLLSGVLEAGYSVTLARALTAAPFGPVYTVVRGGALVVVWPVSFLLFHEKVTLLRAAGTLVVIVGLACAGWSDRGRAEKSGQARGLATAAICALFVGGYYLAYKGALSSGGKPEFVVVISSSISFVALVLMKIGRARVAIEALRDDGLRIVAAGILSTLGFIVFLFAMAQAGAGFVLTLRNTSILFAQGISFFLGERPKRLAIIGAVFVTIGAILLAR